MLNLSKGEYTVTFIMTNRLVKNFSLYIQKFGFKTILI